MLGSILALAASGFSISDTTDNSTGKRDVWALATSEDRNISVAFIRCEEGEVRFSVDFDGLTSPSDWMVVGVETDHSDGMKPVPFSKKEYRSELVMHGSVRETFAGITGHEQVTLTAFSQFRSYTAVFDFSGFEETIQKVEAYCG